MLTDNLFKLSYNLSLKLKILINESHFVSWPAFPVPKNTMVVALILYVFHESAIVSYLDSKKYFILTWVMPK